MERNLIAQKIEANIPPKYANEIIGMYKTRNHKTRYFRNEKTFKEFNLSEKQFLDEILKVKKTIINNGGYIVLKSRHTITNQHDFYESQTTSKIIYRETLYYNGLNKNGNPRYYWGWALNMGDVDVHHINGNKKDNRGGNTEKLNMDVHNFNHDLEILVDCGRLKQSKVDYFIQAIKHNEKTLQEARKELKEILKGI